MPISLHSPLQILQLQGLFKSLGSYAMIFGQNERYRSNFTLHKLGKNGENLTYCVIRDFIEYVLIFYPFFKHWLQVAIHSFNYADICFFYSHFLHGFY